MQFVTDFLWEVLDLFKFLVDEKTLSAPKKQKNFYQRNKETK